MLTTKDIRDALRTQTVPVKRPQWTPEVEGYTPELTALAQAQNQSDLENFKNTVRQAYHEDLTALSHEKQELNRVSAPHRQRISQLNAVIDGERKLLGIRKIKRASKVELLSLERAEMQDEIARLKAELAKK